MKKLVIAFSLISLPAFSQQIPNEIMLKVSPEELNFIGQALDTMPYGKTAPFIAKLHAQVAEQLKPKETLKQETTNIPETKK